jgi:lipopolysaccharide/colanic/teichoic acid biosynthesis glycosyltransferase
MNYNPIFKRIFDVIFALLLLIILTPVYFLIAIVIKIDSSTENVLFIQRRVGKNGKVFNLLKFRTMNSVVENRIPEFNLGDNSRVTAPGRILRKTKLDELPQLINVIKGEMSFVGPRPEVTSWTKYYIEQWREVHTVRPGITDYASITYRNEEYILKNAFDPDRLYRDEILPKKLKLYTEYINNISWKVDFKILLKTFLILIKK